MMDPAMWGSILASGWSDIGQTAFWVALLKIMWINILLSGDNAVVIAMAWRGGSPRQAIAMTTALSPESRILIHMILRRATQNAVWPMSLQPLARMLPHMAGSIICAVVEPTGRPFLAFCSRKARDAVGCLRQAHPTRATSCLTSMPTRRNATHAAHPTISLPEKN